MAFTYRVQRFIEEYVDGEKPGNGTFCAVKAGFSAHSAHTQAHKLLSDSKVRAEIDRLTLERSIRSQVSSTEALTMLADRARADVRELVEVHRDCCRHCYGRDNDYHETIVEQRARRKQFDQSMQEIMQSAREGQALNLPVFDERGGIGFDPRKPPAQDCPACFGRGEVTVIMNDTRFLRKGAVSIYDGAKITQNGLEIKVTDRMKPIEMLAKHLKLLAPDGFADPDGQAPDSGGMTYVGVGPEKPE